MNVIMYLIFLSTKKGETNIGCQGNMANWDIEKFTFFVPICDDLDMVVHIHVLHDEHKWQQRCIIVTFILCGHYLDYPLITLKAEHEFLMYSIYYPIYSLSNFSWVNFQILRVLNYNNVWYSIWIISWDECIYRNIKIASI